VVTHSDMFSFDEKAALCSSVGSCKQAQHCTSSVQCCNTHKQVRHQHVAVIPEQKKMSYMFRLLSIASFREYPYEKKLGYLVLILYFRAS
jgi:hypothetical protein